MRLLSETALTVFPCASPTCALVLDADRTLAEVDTGRMLGRELCIAERIRDMFGQRGYTSAAFREHAKIWSTVALDEYRRGCARVAANTALRPYWLDVLSQLGSRPVTVLTAGSPRIWRAIMARHGLGHISVFGGLHDEDDDYCLSPSCKAWVVAQLQQRGHMVAAAGDSLIDLPMLQRADHALFVPDKKGSPALIAQRATLPNALHLAVDAQRFAPWPALDARQLVSLLRAPISYAC